MRTSCTSHTKCVPLPCVVSRVCRSSVTKRRLTLRVQLARTTCAYTLRVLRCDTLRPLGLESLVCIVGRKSGVCPAHAPSERALPYTSEKVAGIRGVNRRKAAAVAFSLV